MWDELPPSVSQSLLSWLRLFYGVKMGRLKPEAPI
ncbi:hypothetical protein Krac_1914 [Ktedonobacter racemifer DSM 44963]|uniref:Uncharacterized protein n=1 Tax=Ktedonobacter racemifer DSM 44963 TaxID=485913 RepID=D6U3X5_KTERA|nr:hypothetical protein Krac_1914 [Ktedonobacter racemifer DSM 44963]